jgi:hypothetical protein
MSTSAGTIWRAYVTDGVSSSGNWNPQKSDIIPFFAGVLDNTYRGPAGAYSVTTDDAGATLDYVGTSFSAITFGAASSYAAKHANLIINSSARCLSVAPTGLTAQKLYPGQYCLVYNLNGAGWFMSTAGRYYSQSAITLYVDPAGNDSGVNDGLVSGSPFLTVGAAWTAILNETDSPGAVIQLTPGATFPAQGGTGAAQVQLTGDGAAGFGRIITINGDPTFANMPLIQCVGGDFGLVFRDGAWATVSGVAFASSGNGSVGISLQQRSLADVSNCQFGAMPVGTHIQGIDGSDCNILNNIRITGGGVAHAEFTAGAKVVMSASYDGRSSATAFSPAFLIGDFMARILLQNPLTFVNTGSFTGGKYQLTHGSWINSSGGLITPGSTGGTADSTSAYF